MAAGWPPAASDGTVRIWDAATGRERATLTGHTGRVAAVAVAPDGSWLASGGERRDGADLGCGHRAGTGHPDRPHRPGWTAVAVAPDGSWLASGGRDGTVRIWDAATGRERATLTGHTGGVAAVAVAPDGSWLASGGSDGTVRIWDAATGQERAALTGHTGAGGGGGGGAGWQLAGLRRPRRDGADLGRGHRAGAGRPDRPHRRVAAVAVAPDGSWLASGGERRDGADLGRGHRAGAGHPDRPHRPGGGGGGGAGWQLAGLRRRGRDGADLGRGHRASNGPP